MDVYEVVPDDHVELAFRVFCFFEDLHVLQNEVQKAWTSYNDGSLTLVVATIITTAAISLVGRAEKELTEAYRNAVSETSPYQSLAALVLGSKMFTMEGSLDSLVRLNGDSTFNLFPFYDFTYLPLGGTLTRIAKMHEVFEQRVYPAPIPALRPELSSTPEMNKYREEDEIICQMIQDLALQAMDEQPPVEGRCECCGVDGLLKFSVEMKSMLPNFSDIFQDSVRPVWKHGIVTLQSVFASRVLLDIHAICPKFDGENILRKEGERADKLYGISMAVDGRTQFRYELKWTDHDRDLIFATHHWVRDHMVDPTFVQFKKSYRKKQKNKARQQKRKGQVVPPASADTVKNHPDPALHINKNPLFCGTLVLSQMVLTERIGLNLANQHLSIFAMAHLYNALRKMELIDIVWDDMEQIIATQAGPYFAGDIPDSPEEMSARINYRLGLGRGMERMTSKQALTKKELALSPSSSLLLKFFHTEEPLERTIYQLQNNLQRRQKGQASRALTEMSTEKSLSVLSQRKFIGRLEEFAEATVTETQIPYIGLTLFCSRYLEGVRRQLVEAGYDLPKIPKGDMGRAGHQGHRFMVAAILTENKNAMKFNHRPGEMLEFAAGGFEDFWMFMNSEQTKEERELYFPGMKAGVFEEENDM